MISPATVCALAWVSAFVGLYRPRWGFFCLLTLAVLCFSNRPWEHPSVRQQRPPQDLHLMPKIIPLPQRSADPLRLRDL